MAAEILCASAARKPLLQTDDIGVLDAEISQLLAKAASGTKSWGKEKEQSVGMPQLKTPID